LISAIDREGASKQEDRGDETAHAPQQTKDLLRSIVRQNWHGRIAAEDKVKSRNLVPAIESHIANITPFLDPIKYETHCVPSIISHSKYMSNEEFGRYLGLLEAMAVGYSSTLEKEIAELVMIGVTATARSISGAERYHKRLSEGIESRMEVYRSGIETRKNRMGSLYVKVKGHERSIFRFLRKGEIARLNRRINTNARAIESLSRRLNKFSTAKGVMSLRLKGRTRA
jgi:hypothetical protein